MLDCMPLEVKWFLNFFVLATDRASLSLHKSVNGLVSD